VRMETRLSFFHPFMQFPKAAGPQQLDAFTCRLRRFASPEDDSRRFADCLADCLPPMPVVPLKYTASKPEPNSSGAHFPDSSRTRKFIDDFGGREGIRTPGILVANEEKSKLRRGARSLRFFERFSIAPPAPPTNCVASSVWRSGYEDS
jgi:hypothetical protein